MFDLQPHALFFAASLLLAVTPGPGLLYVAARALAGGRAEGIASSLGTGVGGLVHVVAGSLGVSALVMASAQAFTVLKLLGSVYLVVLGVRTIVAARRAEAAALPAGAAPAAAGTRRAFREGVLVEAFNPKTAAFFLAFLPQFVDVAAGHVALQFAMLGAVSVSLNTLADVVVACAASRIATGAAASPRRLRRLGEVSGAAMVALGLGLALARRPSA